MNDAKGFNILYHQKNVIRSIAFRVRLFSSHSAPLTSSPYLRRLCSTQNRRVHSTARMASEIAVLYDIPTKGENPVCWSLNPWKTRLVLNYKNIPYKTHWVEYPNLKPYLKSIGVAPNPPPKIAYTVPTLYLPPYTPQPISESRDHAALIEEHFPNPPLHLSSPILPKVESSLPKILGPLAPAIFPLMPKILNPVSAEYFSRTRREQRKVDSLDAWMAEKGGDQAWKAAEEPIKEFASLLKETDGVYFMGNEVSYADFVLVTMIQWFRVIGGEGEDAPFKRFLRADPAFQALWDACEPLLGKKD